ncbi:N-acetylmuramic acid 6-phosphate etherase [soil metagenome]
MSSIPGTELANEEMTPLDQMTTLGMLEHINGEDARVPVAVRAELPAVGRAVDALAERLGRGGRLILVGAGTSGRLALMQAAEAPPTFGIPPTMVIAVMAGGSDALARPKEGAEDDAAAGAEEIQRLTATDRDSVVGISASGRTPFVLGAMGEARERGALTIGLCCDHPAPVSDAADIPIHPIVGPEVIAGSTRLKAGTAQKLVLDMLTTGLMVRLGYVHANLMVGVQGTNAKLRDRAQRIVAQVSGRSDAAVEQALAESGWSARVAIVMLARGVDAAESRRLLEGGRLSDLIGGSSDG